MALLFKYGTKQDAKSQPQTYIIKRDTQRDADCNACTKGFAIARIVSFFFEYLAIFAAFTEVNLNIVVHLFKLQIRTSIAQLQ
ncbi:hypothetical protein AC626_21130 [Pseudoalteromonas rubra]|uniref:Uncharacterized protein n=1 Tax=Pseudoalteromonas rubra TaxID=43658 RepID=A0A0L0EN21_9GAMM|nr:hypothetical protein AC626_21130 [Pseudoalteromonas rubra]